MEQMKPNDATELVAAYAEIAGTIMEERGEVLPVMFIGGKDGPAILDLRDMFSGPLAQKDRRKDIGVEAVRDLLAAQDADWCLMIVEAWTANLKPEDVGKDWNEVRKHIPPGGVKDVPGREEVVWFQFEDQELGSRLAKRVIIREGDKARLGPLQWMTIERGYSEGRFVGLLPVRGRRQ
jgi:hypothetical protein